MSFEINPFEFMKNLNKHATGMKGQNTKVNFPSIFDHIQKLFCLKNPFI
jgi:hypothetical protein